jgi:hypothetical protein
MHHYLLAVLEQKLFAEVDGNKFSRHLQKMIKTHATEEREQVISVLIKYAKTGRLLHWREMLMPDVITLVYDADTQYTNFFEWTLTMPKLSYWGVDGLLKTAGKAAYAPLVAFAQTQNNPLESRAKAIKSLSVYSKQHFDQGLAEDPGYWKTSDLRVSEVLAWQAEGYADGVAYEAPKTHDSLKKPKSDFEKLVSKFDKKLATARQAQQDLANPSCWLVIADESDVIEIQTKWELPSIYLNFITNYSPLRVFVSKKIFIEGLHFYGAQDLLQAQAGYAFHPETHEYFIDWPKDFVVIGDDAGNPYCIDIGNLTDGDAPIYTAEHGSGAWSFVLASASFMDFLRFLIDK